MGVVKKAREKRERSCERGRAAEGAGNRWRQSNTCHHVKRRATWAFASQVLFRLKTDSIGESE